MIDSKSNTWKCGICWWFSEESKDMVPLFSIIHLQQVLFSSVISKLNYILSRERRVYHIYKQKDQMKNDFLIAIIFKGLSLLVRILYKKYVCVCFPGQEPACQFRRLKRFRFNPWVRKTPLEEGMATQSSIRSVAKSWTQLKWLSTHTHVCI